MQAADLLHYIKNPHLLDKKSTADLQKLVNDFPYFQAAHLLLSLSSKKWDASVYQQSLKKTAIVAPNRAHLFNLIHQFENDIIVEDKPVPELEVKEVTIQNKIEEKIQEDTNKQEIVKHELTILKATEVFAETKNEEITNATKKPLAPEEILEKEIENQVVTAFVEKEILKIQELHHTHLNNKEDHANFSDWLLFLKKNNGQSYKKMEENVSLQKEKISLTKNQLPTPSNKLESDLSKKEKKKALIDKIIDTNPGLIKNKQELKFYTPDNKAKESLIENEHLVTETLAKIYAIQGSVNKAVRAYEILSLKFPQKSAYFASLIQKLKNNQ